LSFEKAIFLLPIMKPLSAATSDSLFTSALKAASFRYEQGGDCLAASISASSSSSFGRFIGPPSSLVLIIGKSSYLSSWSSSLMPALSLRSRFNLLFSRSLASSKGTKDWLRCVKLSATLVARVIKVYSICSLRLTSLPMKSLWKLESRAIIRSGCK
jgi:hypothetical protein